MDIKIMDNKWIGKRAIRPDGADKVTGRAAFGADHSLPGMLWGKVLRSPHPHGIRGVGEVPIVPPMAAVANAIQDAAGLRLNDLPMSPPKVLAALDENS